MTLYLGDKKVAGLATNKVTTGFNIFDVKFSDHLINDIQWLRADTFSWQSGDVYVTAYNTLLEEYSNGVEETEEFMDEGLHPSIIFRRSPNGYKIVNVSNFNDATENLIQDKYNTDGVAWYYILDTTNKRFKLPRTKFGFKGLRDTVGNGIDEKLPNIKGEIASDLGGQKWLSWNVADGAFYREGNATNCFSANVGGTHTRPNWIHFNASRSSSTYQDNAPVQERGTQMYLYFYVGEYSRPAIEQTAGITSEQLNNKVDVDSSWAFPSNRYIDLTLGASGTTYTAPANGNLYISKQATASNQYIRMMVTTNNVVTNIIRTYSTTSQTLDVYFKDIKKGDVVQINYNAGGATNDFRFIYAEGAK